VPVGLACSIDVHVRRVHGVDLLSREVALTNSQYINPHVPEFFTVDVDWTSATSLLDKFDQRY